MFHMSILSENPGSQYLLQSTKILRRRTAPILQLDGSYRGISSSSVVVAFRSLVPILMTSSQSLA